MDVRAQYAVPYDCDAETGGAFTAFGDKEVPR
jgi:hypothetical protein